MRFIKRSCASKKVRLWMVVFLLIQSALDILVLANIGPTEAALLLFLAQLIFNFLLAIVFILLMEQSGADVARAKRLAGH